MRLAEAAALTIAVTAILTAQPASAQTDDGGPPNSGEKRPERINPNDEVIYVTAQRREERLVDVPVSVTAVSQSQIDRAQIRTVSGITQAVPNIQINETIGNTFGPLITIRGLSPASDTSLARDQPVGLYIDGVPVSKSTGAAFDVVDLERVEVLRGPQGTLYGRNTIGGAVNLITRDPSGEYGGHALAGGGRFGAFEGRVNVDLPEVAGVSAKIGVINRRDGGFFQNSALPGNFGEENVWAGRIDLLWRPADNFTARYSYDLSDSSGTPSQLALTAISLPALEPLLDPFLVDERTRTIGAQSAQSSNFETSGHALTLEWRPAGLGDLTLKSITALRTAATRSQSDFDGTPIDLLRFTLNNDYEQISQELQAIGAIGDFNYTLGFFFLDDDYETSNPRWNFQFGGDENFDVSERVGGSTSYAGYGQISWTPQALDEKLTLSVGGRYTSEEKRASSLFLANEAFAADPFLPGAGVFLRAPDGRPITRSGGPASAARPGAGGVGFTDLIPVDASGVWSAFNPEFNLLYKFDDDISVYGRVATGFKSGGVNDTAATNDAFFATFDPENLTSYEAGVRLSGFENRIRLNATAYHSVYRDFQAGVFVPELVTTNIINAGEAQFTGVEVEGVLRPTDALSVNFGGGYVDARYTDFVLPDGADVTDEYLIPRAPEWNFLVAAVHRHDVGFGVLETVLDYNWRSRQTTRVIPDPLSELPSYGIFNARLGLTDIALSSGSTLEVALWGRNLTDEQYLVSALNVTVFTVSQFGDPRTFGGEVRLRF